MNYRQHIFERQELTVFDFISAKTLTFELEDGSTLTLHSAIMFEEGRFYAVYTEHAGYFAILKDTVVSRSEE